MKAYRHENNIFIVQNIASANTIISSIVGEARRIVNGFFSKNYIRHTRINTGMSLIDVNKNKYHNNKVDKIPYPSMTISPEISLEDPFDMNRHTFLTDANVMLRKDMRGILKCILQDPNNKFEIYNQSDRITTNIHFSIKVNSFAEATRLAFYLKSRLPKGFVFYNDKNISVELPKTFVKLIAELNGMGVGLDVDSLMDQRLNDLELYLANVCQTDSRIQLKKDLSTGKWCFFYNNLVNFTSLLTDLTVPSEPVLDGTSEGEYEISFRFQITCTNPNTFIFQINTNKLQNVIIDNPDFGNIIGDDSVSDGFYSTHIVAEVQSNKHVETFNDIYGAEWVGQRIVKQTYTYDINNKISYIALPQILKSDLMKIHSYAKEKNIELSGLLHVRISGIDTEYSVDYNNLSVTFKNELTSDFTLHVWLNRGLYESLVGSMNDNKFYLHPNALDKLKVQYTDPITKELSEHQIAIYKFENDNAMYTTDINKSLRINTMYGIGYIGLVNEHDPYASPVKVCVGIDEYEHPIIRCLELTER